MYRYKVAKSVPEGDIVSQLHPEYIKMNDKGFADVLSCCLETTNQLRCAKDKIENIKETVWEDIKKATNPYELIYAAPTCAVASVNPLSRSFFKMIEMINEFASDLMKADILVSLHIAEGPGGFIEATRYIRQSKRFNTDVAFGITLMNSIDNGEYVKNIPAWKQSNYFIRNHPEVIISYGADGTGNIYNPNNINHLHNEMRTYCKKKYNIDAVTCTTIESLPRVRAAHAAHDTQQTGYGNNMFMGLDVIMDHDNAAHIPDNYNNYNNYNGVAMFITADGGFDYSIDYNYQEQASSKLMFSQIITALKCQSIKGTFVCKIFDMNLFITIEMLYLLNLLYDDIIIYKPLTSRIANSEKYLICTGFKGVEPALLDKLFMILEEWNNANQNKETFNRLGLDVPADFINEMKSINKIIVSKQINVINGIMNIYYNKLNLCKEWKKENTKIQYSNAVEWCQKYNIPYR